jgi:hypothetical protein
MIASKAGWTRKKPRAHYVGVRFTMNRNILLIEIGACIFKWFVFISPFIGSILYAYLKDGFQASTAGELGTVIFFTPIFGYIVGFIPALVAGIFWGMIIFILCLAFKQLLSMHRTILILIGLFVGGFSGFFSTYLLSFLVYIHENDFIYSNQNIFIVSLVCGLIAGAASVNEIKNTYNKNLTKR